MYDKTASALTEKFASRRLHVTTVEVGRAGALTVSCEGDLHVEAFPTCAGPFEAWRVFRHESSDGHHGYPQHTL